MRKTDSAARTLASANIVLSTGSGDSKLRLPHPSATKASRCARSAEMSRGSSTSLRFESAHRSSENARFARRKPEGSAADEICRRNERITALDSSVGVGANFVAHGGQLDGDGDWSGIAESVLLTECRPCG